MSDEEADPLDKIMRMFRIGAKGPQETRISEQMIINSTKEYNWEGSGSKVDPIIIESFEGFGPRIRIVNSKLFILFKNCNFNSLTIQSCEQITFESCEITNLRMIRCINLSFLACIIFSLNILSSTNNYFKKGSFRKVEILYTHDNVFEDCITSKRNFKKLSVDPSSKSISPKTLLGIIIITIIFIPIMSVFLALEYYIQSIISIISYLISMALYVEFHERRVKDRKRFLNKIIKGN